MNIFYLDRNPIRAAAYHCDKHCVKMILETAQLLSTAHRELDGNEMADRLGLYKSTHKNHPSAVWVRQGWFNYQWTFHLFKQLLKQYTARYGKEHKTGRLLDALATSPVNIPSVTVGSPLPPQCMPDEYKREDTVEAYRAYYRGAKAGFAKWSAGQAQTPHWW